jgi:FAD/FMN-containing dehydrogenase
MGGVVQSLAQPAFSSEIPAQVRAHAARDATCLVIGNLRSYGDEVLNPQGRYVQTTHCDRILGVDAQAHTVTAECGISLQVLQQRLEPLGYMLPVTPGTAHLTLGGAIANDVHGKNHHVAGTFGCFVEGFELARSSGEVLQCSLQENAEYFAATVGGMGLTGAITRATVKLRRPDSFLLDVTSRRFANLDEFFELDLKAKERHEYTVAWIDCLSRGASLGRGIYSVADHAAGGVPLGDPASHERPGGGPPAGQGPPGYRATVPFTLPVSPVNKWSLSLMNSAYFRLHRTGRRTVRYNQWLYPLDTIGQWNRLYGKRGFLQFQCVVPPDQARTAITEMLQTTAARGLGSFLAVLKNFGPKPSPGLMSFPMPGATLALDFPNQGDSTRRLLLDLYDIARLAGGRLYAAKDGCSPPGSLKQGYPEYERFKRLIDPGFGSVMAQRLQLVT